MDEQTLNALRADRIIDITTTGRKSGEARRIEIAIIAVKDGFVISGTPGRPRSWYANMRAHPEFTVHAKRSITADLPARAVPVETEPERRALIQQIADANAKDGRPMTNFEEWVAKSPLVKVEFLA